MPCSTQPIRKDLPRLVGGLAFSWASKFDEVRSSSQTLRVTRMENGVEIAYDSAVSSGRVDRSGNWRFAPILGLDWAPWLPIEKLRMVVGVSPLNARNEWVAGVSLTQVLSGLQRETVGVDLHLVSHWLRPEVVRDAAACRGPTADCGTTRQSLRPIGVGLMLSVDGTTLLKELVTAFPFGG